MVAPTTRNLTILLTDIKGFTDKTSHRSRADIQRLLDDHRDVVLPVLQARGGKLIKTIGDAFLMVFESPTDAVLAGLSAQEALAKRNAPLPEEERIEIRIAINVGEVNLVEGDVYGEPVNIAARIEGVAEAGEVYFTEAVYLAMNKTEVPSSEVGLLQLKGIPEKIRVYKVRRETPLGVGQVPAAPAPRAAAGGFAPGEKARLVSTPAAIAAISVAAPAAASYPLPSSWRRAAALCLDALFCALILACFTGRRHWQRPRSAPASAAVGAAALPGSVKAAVDAEVARTVSADAQDAEFYGPVSRFNVNWGFALVWVVYGMIFLKRNSATPGKTILKLKIISVEGAGPELTKRQRWLRPAASLLSGYIVFLGYLWALWDPQKRGWHDHLAGTRVVSAE